MKKIILMIMFIAVSACSLSPPKAKPGMALIDGAYLRGEDKNTQVGRIVTVKSESSGKELKLSPYTHNLDVVPGKYTVGYFCHSLGVRNYKEYAKKNPQIVKTSTVDLQAGEMLYVRPEIKYGHVTGYFCIPELKIAKSK